MYRSRAPKSLRTRSMRSRYLSIIYFLGRRKSGRDTASGKDAIVIEFVVFRTRRKLEKPKQTRKNTIVVLVCYLSENPD